MPQLRLITQDRIDQIIQQHFRDDVVRFSVEEVARATEQEAITAVETVWRQADPGGALQSLSPAQARAYALSAVLTYIQNSSVGTDIAKPTAYLPNHAIPVPEGYTVGASGSPGLDRTPLYTIEQIAAILEATPNE